MIFSKLLIASALVSQQDDDDDDDDDDNPLVLLLIVVADKKSRGMISIAIMTRVFYRLDGVCYYLIDLGFAV